MTEKVFWNNPYQTEIISVVTQITGNNVELSHTIFYAESGGQESDEGTIAGIPVVKAEKSGSRIIYTLETRPTFAVGDEVVTEIDWPRRYALMKLHFAAEVVLELFTQNFNSITKIGAHISEDKSRIDFEWPENIAPLLPALQYKAQALIDSDSIITSEFSDQTKERRYWKVEGFAQVPCGGTHLKRTSEVGKIALKRKNVGKGKERVEITLVREDT
ncbi:alanyl-tRNA editing protein [Vibrio natriegens]|uniref:alanine--tRNA ligase-related protein n=1 Tax=Vibrio natriegens TaxID=691 RepID=UPI000804206A|nr:alanyl-tRNA editing protein [Vibrio natriegens]ANQ17032.1 alanyl-tRNA editing protein [Vibrio natriegens]MCY9878920.1 alanyl-tRNA editing protein [Vibrio natriegens]